MSEPFAPPGGPDPVDPQQHQGPQYQDPQYQTPQYPGSQFPQPPDFGQTQAQIPGQIPGQVPGWGSSQPGSYPGIGPASYPGQGAYPGQPPLGWAPPPAKRRSSSPAVRVVPVVIVALIGAYFAWGGNSSSDPGPTVAITYPGFNEPVSTTAPAPTATTESASCVPSVVTCLMPVPKGASAWTDSWGRSPTVVSASAYVDHFYADKAAATRQQARLGDSGLGSIAKSTWKMASGDEADDDLLSFDSVNGAQSWYDHDTNGSTGTQFTIPGLQDSQGYNRAADSSGVSWTVVFALSGSTVMELWTQRDDHNDQGAATTWALAQMQVVNSQISQRVVPAASTPTPPAYTAIGSASQACVSATTSIDACLMSAPAGSTPWTGKPYYGLTDVTVQQYVAEDWNQADQATKISSLQSDGVELVAHRNWLATDDTQADVTVLQFPSALDAQTAGSDYATAMDGTTFDIPDLSSASGETHALNSNGDINVHITAYSGPYVIDFQFFSPATANITEAVQLFEQEYSLLPSS